MEDLNLGMKPSTIQSWSRDAIRSHFRQLQKDHPDASHKQLIQLFDDLIAEDRFVRRSASEYLVGLMLDRQEEYERKAESVTPPRQRTERTPEQRAEQKAAIAEAAKKALDKILLLNQEAPNGKRWRYVLREELAQFNGGYGRLVKRMQPSQMIGQAVDEAEFRDLLGL